MTNNISFNIHDGIDPSEEKLDNIILEAYNRNFNISAFMKIFKTYVNNLKNVLDDVSNQMESHGGIALVQDLKEAQRTSLYYVHTIKKISEEI